MSKFGRALSKSLDHHEDWMIRDRFTITHKPSGIELWVASGGFFFDAIDRNFENENVVGLLERHWLYRKAKGVKSSLMCGKLTSGRI